MPRLATLTALVATLDAPAAGGEPRLVRCHKSRWGSVFRVQYVPPDKASMTCVDVCASRGEVCQTVIRATTCDEYNIIPSNSVQVSPKACHYRLAPGRACSCGSPPFVAMLRDFKRAKAASNEYLRTVGEPDVRTCVEGVTSSTLLLVEVTGEPAAMPTCSTACAESTNAHRKCVGHMKPDLVSPGLPMSCHRFQANHEKMPRRAAGADELCNEVAPPNTACLCAAEKPLLCGIRGGAAVIISPSASSPDQCTEECVLAGFGSPESTEAVFLGRGFNSCQEAMRGKPKAPFVQAVGRGCRCHGGVDSMAPPLAAQRVCGTAQGETRVVVSTRDASFTCDEMCAARGDFSPNRAVCGGVFKTNWVEGACNDEVLVVNEQSDECRVKLVVDGARVCRCIILPMEPEA